MPMSNASRNHSDQIHRSRKRRHKRPTFFARWVRNMQAKLQERRRQRKRRFWLWLLVVLFSLFLTRDNEKRSTHSGQQHAKPDRHKPSSPRYSGKPPISKLLRDIQRLPSRPPRKALEELKLRTTPDLWPWVRGKLDNLDFIDLRTKPSDPDREVLVTKNK